MRKWMLFVFLVLLVSGCSRAGDNEYTAGDLRAKNHVAGQSINWFKVNGYRAPGLGGGYCCVMLPEKWTPGLKAHVEWEVDPNKQLKFLYEDRSYVYNGRKKLAVQFTKNTRAVVDIPQYGEERCGITVHFLPCNQVKVTTICDGYGTPNYPIKEPLEMKEPAQCPK